jgi:hypothetical protein
LVLPVVALDQPGAVSGQVLDEAARGVDDPVDADKAAGAPDDLARNELAVPASKRVNHSSPGHARSDDRGEFRDDRGIRRPGAGEHSVGAGEIVLG